MCLIIFDWRPDARSAHEARFTLAANRDEFLSRAATPLSWWHDAPQVLAGRDLQGGGTWLGVHRDGRFAALTNYRAPGEKQFGGPSRGKLVADFLNGPPMAPLDYLEQLARTAGTEFGVGVRGGGEIDTQANFDRGSMPGSMRGFNLLAGNLADGQLAYFSNRSDLPPALLPAGCYGLSNALLDTDWPKVTAKKAALREILAQPAQPDQGPGTPGTDRLDALLTMMYDTRVAPDEALPATGLALERERALSAAYIVAPDYGTRCTTALQCDASGRIGIVERGDSKADGTRTASGMHLSRYGFQLGTRSPA